MKSLLKVFLLSIIMFISSCRGNEAEEAGKDEQTVPQKEKEEQVDKEEGAFVN